MSSHEPAILKTLDGEAMPLTGVNARGILAGDLFELTVEQRYRNPGKTNIEAVYTFPLPAGAVLLGLEFELNGRTLSGVAVEKKEAERQYEDTIDEGDTAILLERSEAGLYTVNLGNLMAGEEAVVRYRYAEPLAWEQGRLRLAIPTTVAPRYGDAIAAGLQPHQVPEADLGVAYPFTLAIDVLGDLAKGAITSPSHLLATAVIDNGLRVSLAKGWLDRDFVLLVEGIGRSHASVAPDGEGWVVMAAFCPELPDTDTDLPLSLRLVIDCSGSMGGDSIRAARQAALKVVESLRDADEFDVTLFGSQHRHVFGRLVPADRRHVMAATPQLMAVDANMGGTEMESALASAARLPSAQQGGTFLLITDGEIWGVDSLIASARASGLRYFVVGVGSSPSHATLRRLADETGGSYEAVSPNEEVEAAILRLFARMRQPRARDLRLVWEHHPAWQLPLPKALFKGDTLHAFAGFDAAPGGKVRLQYKLDDGTVREEWAPVTAWPGQAETLARIAAARRIEAAARATEGLGEPMLLKPQLTELAVAYNLVTEFTHYLVVHERAEGDKAADLPETVKVRNMLAAGWGGAGSIAFSNRMATPAICYSLSSGADIPTTLRSVARHQVGKVNPSDRLYSILYQEAASSTLDIPAFLRKRVDRDDRLDAWVRRIAALVLAGGPIEEDAFDELLGLVMSETAGALREIARQDGHETAVRAFLAAYARSVHGDGLPRHLRRELRHLVGGHDMRRGFFERLRDALAP